MLKKMVEILRMWFRKERVSVVENGVVETPPEVVEVQEKKVKKSS